MGYRNLVSLGWLFMIYSVINLLICTWFRFEKYFFPLNNLWLFATLTLENILNNWKPLLFTVSWVSSFKYRLKPWILEHSDQNKAKCSILNFCVKRLCYYSTIQLNVDKFWAFYLWKILFDTVKISKKAGLELLQSFIILMFVFVLVNYTFWKLN